MPEQHVNDLQCNSYLTNTKLFVYVTSGVRFWYRWEGGNGGLWMVKEAALFRRAWKNRNGQRWTRSIHHWPFTI